MMIGRRTSCRKFDESQFTRTVGEPCWIAAGNATSAMSVKTYAQYIVPTILVIPTANAALRRPIGPVPWTRARISSVRTSLGTCTRGFVISVICLLAVSGFERETTFAAGGALGLRFRPADREEHGSVQRRVVDLPAVI